MNDRFQPDWDPKSDAVSVLRNWTVGEVGTISAAIGILVHYLSEHGDLQQRLRARP
jgi:cytochrome P450